MPVHSNCLDNHLGEQHLSQSDLDDLETIPSIPEIISPGALRIYMMLFMGAGLGIYCAFLLTPKVYEAIYDNSRNDTADADNKVLEVGAVVGQAVVDALLIPAGILAGYAVAKGAGYVASGVNAKLSNARSYVGSFFHRSTPVSSEVTERTYLLESVVAQQYPSFEQTKF